MAYLVGVSVFSISDEEHLPASRHCHWQQVLKWCDVIWCDMMRDYAKWSKVKWGEVMRCDVKWSVRTDRQKLNIMANAKASHFFDYHFCRSHVWGDPSSAARVHQVSGYASHMARTWFLNPDLLYWLTHLSTLFSCNFSSFIIHLITHSCLPFWFVMNTDWLALTITSRFLDCWHFEFEAQSVHAFISHTTECYWYVDMRA